MAMATAPAVSVAAPPVIPPIATAAGGDTVPMATSRSPAPGPRRRRVRR